MTIYEKIVYENEIFQPLEEEWKNLPIKEKIKRYKKAWKQYRSWSFWFPFWLTILIIIPFFYF